MGVKIEDIKPGDKVRSEWLIVDGVVGNSVQTEKGVLRLTSIAEHEPAPREIKVGDRVTWGRKTNSCEVLAVCRGMAWLFDKHMGGLYMTECVERLEHVN